ncbi:uncharacterized protein CMC5_084450 [Chondromyces crocatus]|uniref:Phosphatidic acid phosphatase type 2/haloperoxidase domain-containing protein n=2 Tax=Chondromyces crocatus TaxID=52 RepID=A0A0K1ETF2_CHOCO|nr:uncharacterized protein CMC5_084450 [Chondromyces crocatus]
MAGVPTPAWAPKVAWDPRWPKFRPVEYAATVMFAGLAAGSFLIQPVPSRWRERNGFDDSVRDGLQLRAEPGRAVARGVSDVLIGLTLAHQVVDAGLVAWWQHDQSEVALQMLLIDAETVLLAMAVQGLVAGFVSRERPYADRCVGPEASQPDRCLGNDRYRSFFSGHATVAFTSAGLTCTHHLHQPLYGGGAGDVAACASSLLAAATVGTLRVVGDQHHASDVILGATWGTLVGFGLPWLLHYRGGAKPAPRDVQQGARAGSDEGRAPRRDQGLTMSVVPSGLGGALVGQF